MATVAIMPQQAFAGVGVVNIEGTPIDDLNFNRFSIEGLPSSLTFSTDGGVLTVTGPLSFDTYFPMTGPPIAGDSFSVSSIGVVGGSSGVTSTLDGTISADGVFDGTLVFDTTGVISSDPTTYFIGGITPIDPQTGLSQSSLLVVSVNPLYAVADLEFSGPDLCAFFHWHIFGIIFDIFGLNPISDPNQSGCGLDTVDNLPAQNHVLKSVAPVCGDGNIDTGEECDDGNMINTDACLNSCKLATCGDTFVWQDMETCEPPNTATCDAQCMTRPEIDMAIEGTCDEENSPGEAVRCEMTILNNGLFDVVSAGMSLHIAFPNYITEIDVPSCRGILDTTLNPDGSWDASCSDFSLHAPGGLHAETLDWIFDIDLDAVLFTLVLLEFLAGTEDGDEDDPDDEFLQHTIEIGQAKNRKPIAKIKINDDNGRKQVSKTTKIVSIEPDPDTGKVKPVELDGSKSYPGEKDDKIETYKWTLTPPNAFSKAKLEPNDEVSKPTFTPDEPGIYKIELVVNDGDVNSNPKTRSITGVGNAPPTADAGDPQEVLLPGAGVVRIFLDGSASRDPEGEIDFLQWTTTRDDIPKDAKRTFAKDFSSAEAKTAYDATIAGTYKFTLKIVDDAGIVSVDTVVITVKDQNSPTVDPTFTPDSPSVGDTVTLDARASDPNNDPLMYSWTLQTPAGSSEKLDKDEAATAMPTFTPDIAGTYTATVTVDDGNKPPVTDSVDIVVSAVDPNAPKLTITSPAPGHEFVQGIKGDQTEGGANTVTSGDKLKFTAESTDPQEGDLSNSISWRIWAVGDPDEILNTQGGTANYNPVDFHGDLILPVGSYVVEAEVFDDEDPPNIVKVTQNFKVVENPDSNKKVAPGSGFGQTEDGTKIQGEDFKTVPPGGTTNGAFSTNAFSTNANGVQDTGNADTIVKRLDGASVPNIPGSDTIDIELVALQLVSVQPIDLGAGLDLHYFTLQSIHGGPASTGMMEITFVSSDGGTFDSFFDVFFDIRIGALDGPIIFSDVVTLESFDVPWFHRPGPDALLIKGVNHLLSPAMDSSEDFFPIGIFSLTNQEDPPTILRVSVAQQTITQQPKVVGGELIPIETTSLLLAGAQTFSWMIPLVLSVIGIGLFVVRRK